MSEEKNKKSEHRIENTESKNVGNKQHFPEDSHVPRQPQTSNIEPQTTNMEVRKHPHHITHRKKWGE